MSQPRIVHVNDNVPGAVYIGRSNKRKRLKASPFENPFRIQVANNFNHGTSRNDVLRMYRDYLMSDWLKDGKRPLLAALIGLRTAPALACWCRHDGEEPTPENACHGDVLIELLQRYTDDELRALAEPMKVASS